jgi:serine/threonine protein phosphatase PrpC
MNGNVKVSHATHAGTVRSLNQDRLLDRPDLGLWAVADGAGGHAGGEVAAERIIEDLGQTHETLPMTADNVAQIVGATHRALRGQAKDMEAMISTVAILTYDGAGVDCLWAGDSRIYRYREGRLTQLTRDHSLVEALMEQGRITPEEARHHPRRHVITRAVGAPGDFALERTHAVAEADDIYLLCSDGLCRALDDGEITALLGKRGVQADDLVEAALARGAEDNVTAILVAVC